MWLRALPSPDAKPSRFVGEDEDRMCQLHGVETRARRWGGRIRFRTQDDGPRIRLARAPAYCGCACWPPPLTIFLDAELGIPKEGSHLLPLEESLSAVHSRQRLSASAALPVVQLDAACSVVTGRLATPPAVAACGAGASWSAGGTLTFQAIWGLGLANGKGISAGSRRNSCACGYGSVQYASDWTSSRVAK